jgi:hypothetical protein
VLARPKAVEGRAAAESARPELIVNAATEVCVEVPAGVSGGLVDRELRRCGEGWRHAAQARAL